MADYLDKAPQEPLVFSISDPVEISSTLRDRLRHHADWCLSVAASHEFYYIVNKGAGTAALFSRLIKLSPQGEDVQICCEPETPHPPVTAMMLLVNQISDRMTDGLAVATFDGHEGANSMLTYVNEAMATLFLSSKEELLGRWEQDLLENPSDLGAKTISSQLSFIRQDGSTFLGLLNRTVVTDVTGWPTHAVITCQNVDDQVREHNNREQQRKLDERMQLLAKVGWWELDLESSKLFWSPGMYALYNETHGKREQQPPSFRELMSKVVEADHSRIQKMLSETVEKGVEANAEVRVVAGGRHCWQRLQTFPGRVVDDEVKSVLGTTIDITGTVESEQMRLQQHQELQFYLACLDQHSLLLKLDKNFNVTFANRKFNETLKFARGELHGQNLTRLNAGDAEPYRAAIDSSQSWHGELVQVTNEGALISLDVTMSAASVVSDGEIFFFATDTTAKKLTDEVSRSLTRLQGGGHSPSELIELAMKQLITISDSTSGTLISEGIEVSLPANPSLANLTENGATFPIQFKDEDPGLISLYGRPGGYDEAARDILRPLVDLIVEVEQERRRSLLDDQNELQNRFILETLKIGSWHLNLSTEDWTFSDSLYQLLEYSPGDGGFVPSEMWDERSAPGEREKLEQFLEEMIRSDRTCEVTVMATTPSERQKFIKIQGQVVRGTNGKAREVIGIAEDVSDEVMTRRELENQKSLASHQARLASIGELAAGVGHEINNPLTIIRGFIEIIRGQMASPDISLDEVSELVEKMDDSADRIEKIVRGLRSLSHDDISGSDNFAPDSILRDTVGFVDEIYRRQGVSLEMISDVPTSVRLRGHEGKLQQALMNLLSNARDATEGQDDRKIVANFSVCNSELIIKIQDNGPGIAEPIRERIFQPFFTTKEIGKGTGIGLSLVHSIVQEFRGRVECLESPFGGAEFRVSLPTEAEEPADVEPVKSSGLLEQKFSGRVLVVDDEEGVREFLLLLLSQLGVTVEAVSNGKQALDKIFLEGEVYDAVITDLTMPEMGGLEFVHKMQEEAEGQDQFHQPKVLLATGLPNFHFEEVSYPAVVGILNKPFSLQTLKENLTRLL